MSAEDEQQRLERVYREYETDTAVTTRWSSANSGNTANYRSWRFQLLKIFREAERPIDEQRVLEVGCGSGDVIGGLLDWGAVPENLVGIDLREDCIERARRDFPNIDYRQANAERLEFDDASFDVIMLFTVFTSILDDSISRNVAKEVSRVLKPSGVIVWHDFFRNNPWNPNVRGVGRREIQSLFPGFEDRLRTETLLPPLARRLGPLTPILYPLLSNIPLLKTHLFGVLVKPQTLSNQHLA